MTGAIADARLFLDRGIGLYIFDQRDVEEVLPARYFENTTLSPSPPSGAETDQLRNEIHDLRAQFDLLEQRIHELRQEFTASTKSRSRAEPVIAAAPVPHPSSVSIFSNVPTYLVGNPWVEVLSRRGREDATIAG
jgi:outer membrane murein-binding lipoprotein Lpp